MSEHRQLLEKFVEGRCTGEELRTVHILLGCEAGRKVLDEIIENRERDGLENPPVLDDTMQQWVSTNQPVLQRRIAAHERRDRFFTGRVMLRIAGVFAGVMVLGGTLLWQMRGGEGLFGGGAEVAVLAELTNADGVPELFVLPDGSQVWLAAGSTLKYPEEFSTKHRDVELQGEAFFDVERDEKRPFTIKTGDLQTRVLGTSFKITAFEGHEHEVAVATGKVSVSHIEQGNKKNTELALLTRGASVRHNLETGETTQVEVDPATLDEWKSGTLTLDELPMGLVAQQLQSRYGITIEFADRNVASKRVICTVSPDESVGEVLRLLSRVGKFSYQSTDEKHYTIY